MLAHTFKICTNTCLSHSHPVHHHHHQQQQCHQCCQLTERAVVDVSLTGHAAVSLQQIDIMITILCLTGQQTETYEI